MRVKENSNGIFLVRNKIIPADSIAHIIQRAPGRELLFLENGDYLYFLKLLRETSSKYKIDVYCFVLMPNHFHLLVKFIDDNASKAIKNLCERYAWFFNSKYKRKGHVFYGAFRVSLCLEDSYFLTASLYIHINPAKAGLVSDPGSYRWSSCSLYTQAFSSKTFLKYETILNLLSRDRDKARKIYKELILASLEAKVGNPWGNPKVLLVLRRRLFSSFSRVNKSFFRNEQILDNNTLDKKIKELSRSKRLKKPQHKKARLYLVQQLLSRGYSIEEIAKQLNLSKRTIYNILSRLS